MKVNFYFYWQDGRVEPHEVALQKDGTPPRLVEFRAIEKPVFLDAPGTVVPGDIAQRKVSFRIRQHGPMHFSYVEEI